MKKIIKGIVMVLCLFALVGCNEGKLSDKYNEEELKAAAEEVVKNLNDKNYDGIFEKSSDEFKNALPDNKLKEAWEGFSKNIGEYDSISKITCAEKSGYGVAIVNAQYKDKKVTFTLSFNSDMNLSGLYMK